MADANQDAANFLMGRPVHGGAPPNSEKRNVIAAGRGGRASPTGRGGKGRGSSESGAEKGGFDTPGSDSTRRAGTPYRDREATPNRERSTVRDMEAVITAGRRATTRMSVRSRRRRTHLRVTLLRKSKSLICFFT